MWRFVLSIVFALFLSFIVYLFLINTAELWLLETWYEVQPLSGVRQKEWLDSFANIALYSALIALVGVICWHFFSYGFYRIKNWRRIKSSRLAWGIIFVITLAAALIFGGLFTEATQDSGKRLAFVFYFLNALIIYGLSSLILSPATVKYAPPGSIWFARIGNIIMRPFN